MSETTEQTRFFDELLCHYPRLAEFWDREKREFQDEKAEYAANGNALSSGERVVLKALASIWLGGSCVSYALDFTEMAALSPDFLKPLVQWLINPFWP